MEEDQREGEFVVNNPEDVNPLYLMKRDEKLENDVSNDTPFSDPDDITKEISKNNQLFDPTSDIDAHEEYDAGGDVASGAKQ